MDKAYRGKSAAPRARKPKPKRPSKLLSQSGVTPAPSLGYSSDEDLAPCPTKKALFVRPEIERYRCLIGAAARAAAFSDGISDDFTHLVEYTAWIQTSTIAETGEYRAPSSSVQNFMSSTGASSFRSLYGLEFRREPLNPGHIWRTANETLDFTTETCDRLGPDSLTTPVPPFRARILTAFVSLPRDKILLNQFVHLVGCGLTTPPSCTCIVRVVGMYDPPTLSPPSPAPFNAPFALIRHYRCNLVIDPDYQMANYTELPDMSCIPLSAVDAVVRTQHNCMKHSCDIVGDAGEVRMERETLEYTKPAVQHSSPTSDFILCPHLHRSNDRLRHLYALIGPQPTAKDVGKTASDRYAETHAKGGDGSSDDEDDPPPGAGGDAPPAPKKAKRPPKPKPSGCFCAPPIDIWAPGTQEPESDVDPEAAAPAKPRKKKKPKHLRKKKDISDDDELAEKGRRSTQRDNVPEVYRSYAAPIFEQPPSYSKNGSRYVTFKCLVDGCGKPVARALNELLTGNLKQHLTSRHSKNAGASQPQLVAYKVQGTGDLDPKEVLQHFALYVACHNRPFLAAKDKWLTPLLHPTAQKNRPDRKAISAAVQDLYNFTRDKLVEIFKTFEGATWLGVVDGWLTPNGIDVLGIDLYYRDIVEDGYRRLKLMPLDFIPLVKSHTGQYLADVLYEVIKFYGLEATLHGVMSDNAKNMEAMVKALGRKPLVVFKGEKMWIRCFAHILNLICCEKKDKKGNKELEDESPDEPEEDEETLEDLVAMLDVAVDDEDEERKAGDLTADHVTQLEADLDELETNSRRTRT
ncbi:hypothetical protein RQP46_003564 [Phenoliferia psychrophenolica]